MVALSPAMLVAGTTLPPGTTIAGRASFVPTSTTPGQPLLFGLVASLGPAAADKKACKCKLRIRMLGTEEHRAIIARALGDKATVRLDLGGAVVDRVDVGQGRGKEVVEVDVRLEHALRVELDGGAVTISANDSPPSQVTSIPLPPSSAPSPVAGPSTSALSSLPSAAVAPGPLLRRITEHQAHLHVADAGQAPPRPPRRAASPPAGSTKKRRVDEPDTPGPSVQAAAQPAPAAQGPAGPAPAPTAGQAESASPAARHAATAMARNEQLASRVRDMRQAGAHPGEIGPDEQGADRPPGVEDVAMNLPVDEVDQVEVDEQQALPLARPDEGDETPTGQPDAEVPAGQPDRSDDAPAASSSAAPSSAGGYERRQRRRRAEAEWRERAEATRAECSMEAERRERDLELLRRGVVVNDTAYTPLARARPGHAPGNVFGVVVHVNEIKKGRGADHSVTVVLADPSNYTGPQGDHFAVTIFRRHRDVLAGWRLGAAVVMHGLKLQQWDGRVKGTMFANGINSWAWDGCERGIVLDDRRKELLRGLDAWYAAAAEGSDRAPVDAGYAGAAGVAVPRGRQWCEIGRMEPDTFCNVVAQVMHVHDRPGYEPPREVYLSDGTVSTYATRNFLELELDNVPPSAIIQVSLYEESDDIALEPGDCIAFENVRLVLRDGEAELKWGGIVSEEQKERGWKRKRIVKVGADDERAKLIARRIKALQDGRPLPLSPEEPRLGATAAALAPPPPLATHLATRHRHPTDHPVSALADVRAGVTVPNRFRTRARVAEILPRGVKGAPDALVFQYCAKCANSFLGNFCMTCNDSERARTSYRYMFGIVLEDGNVRLPVLVSSGGRETGDNDGVDGDDGDDNARWLPRLPDGTEKSPGALQHNRAWVERVSAETASLLLGAPLNGARPRPVIDWTLESYPVGGPGGAELLVWRVHGMRAT